MIRVAFTLIGGTNWTGGYNYLLNLLRALSLHTADRMQSVLFLGTDLGVELVSPFKSIPRLLIVRDAGFNEIGKGSRLRQAILTGCDQIAATAFSMHDIDVVFEPAQFYGWRFPIAAIAWIPDFQHRYLKRLFNFGTYWKREIGFRAQILSGRPVMLSSNDAREDCERFYPTTRGRTHVVRFAVPAAASDGAAARTIADEYGLPVHFFFLPNQFWKHKNHECVIKALQIVKQRGTQIVIAVTGKQADPRDPTHFPGLQRMIVESGLESDFRLLGMIPHDHIGALMRSCAALINPSTFEGWSTTVEEAKAEGTPMILSSLLVHREQCPEATYFDPASPLELAEILLRFIPVDISRRMEMTVLASAGSHARIEKFAYDFSAVVEKALRHT